MVKTSTYKFNMFSKSKQNIQKTASRHVIAKLLACKGKSCQKKGKTIDIGHNSKNYSRLLNKTIQARDNGMTCTEKCRKMST